MTIKRAVGILAGFLIFFPAWGQVEDSLADGKRSLHYYNSFLSGALLGEEGKGTSFSFTTTHGIRYNQLAIGLGVGHDSYIRWRTFPLFASVSFDLFTRRRNVIYLQANAGHAIIRPRELNDNQIEYDAKGGLMLNPMVGYRLATEKYSLYISAGYKMQRNEYSLRYAPWIWPSPMSQTIVTETIERVAVQIGFGFY